LTILDLGIGAGRDENAAGVEDGGWPHAMILPARLSVEAFDEDPEEASGLEVQNDGGKLRRLA